MDMLVEIASIMVMSCVLCCEVPSHLSWERVDSSFISKSHGVVPRSQHLMNTSAAPIVSFNAMIGDFNTNMNCEDHGQMGRSVRRRMQMIWIAC